MKTAQLGLFDGALREAHANLTWQNEQLTRQVEELRNRLAEAELLIVHLKIQLAETQRDRDQLQRAAARWKALSEGTEIAMGSRRPPLDLVDQELKKLIVLAHPDRWSQGQAAAELAHEVALTLNAVRQRLGVAS